MEVDLRGLHRLVAQPERNYRAVDPRLEQAHRGGVPKHMRSHSLPLESRTALLGNSGVLSKKVRDAIAAQRGAARVGEQRRSVLGGAAVAEPATKLPEEPATKLPEEPATLPEGAADKLPEWTGGISDSPK